MFRSIVFAMTVAASVPAAAQTAFVQPAVIRYGATVAETRAALDGQCTTLVVRPINPPFAPNVRREQVQIDCDGFPFMGGGRWAEFVFRDDSLEMVWIMIDAAEQERIVTAMTDAYGAPTHTNDGYIAFAGQRAAWRHRPAEVLFYSPALAAWAENWFD